MDRAVLNAYGWTDIPTDSEFPLDYPIDEDEWGARKKPYRYRWARRRPRRCARPLAGAQRRARGGGTAVRRRNGGEGQDETRPEECGAWWRGADGGIPAFVGNHR